jgi:hypothetical protein
MQLGVLLLEQGNKLVRHLQLLPILVQNVPFLAFIIRHTFGLMVLSDLGRLVPALRRALMLAYRPGFDLFICTFYHTPTAMPFVFLNTRSRLLRIGWGKGGFREPFPLSFADCISICTIGVCHSVLVSGFGSNAVSD